MDRNTQTRADTPKAHPPLPKWGERTYTIVEIISRDDVATFAQYADDTVAACKHYTTSGTHATELQLEHASDLMTLPDQSGWTVEHWAARFGAVQILEYRSNAGVDPSQPDKDGLTPFEVAEHYGKADAMKYLRRGCDKHWGEKTPIEVTHVIAIDKDIKPLRVRPIFAVIQRIVSRVRRNFSRRIGSYDPK